MGNFDLTASADGAEKTTGIFDLIKKQAQKTPDALAIAAPGRPPMTYGGLLEQIKTVVAVLNATGISKNERVAIVLPNGPEMAVCFLAVSACAASAPLNPAYRANEYDFYLKDLNAKALIVQKGVESPARDIADAQNIPILELSFKPGETAGSFKLEGRRISEPIPDGGARQGDTALVLHTSGTTSRPKIVPLTQNNLCVSAKNIAESLSLTGEDRCLNVMPLFHIHGLIGAVLSTLFAGGSVVCSPGFSGPDFFSVGQRVSTHVVYGRADHASGDSCPIGVPQGYNCILFIKVYTILLISVAAQCVR